MKKNNLSNKELVKKFWFDKIIDVGWYHYDGWSDIEWWYQDSGRLLLIFSWKIIYWLFPTYNHMYIIPFDDKNGTISRNEFYSISDENEDFLRENSELSWEIDFREFLYDDSNYKYINNTSYKYLQPHQVLYITDYKIENNELEEYIKNNNLDKNTILKQFKSDRIKLDKFIKYCKEFYF